MSDDQWDAWEEWLSQPMTQAFLSALKSRGDQMKSLWTEAAWGANDPTAVCDEDLRARSRVFSELSDMDRETLSILLEIAT